MTDTERKALALLQECGFHGGYIDRKWNEQYEALCRAIEQHEAFRQEVSDAAERLLKIVARQRPWLESDADQFASFIVAKPDPLVEALDEALWEVSNVKLTDRELRAVSLRLNAKRGGKIVWGEG